jgi:hypothetical protein
VITPPYSVDEPAFESAGFGLYSAFPPLDPGGDREAGRFQNGVTFEPSICGVPGAFPVGCPTPADTFPLDVVEGLEQVTALPFGVSSGVTCKPVGTPISRLRELARTRLRLAEQFAVEHAYWTGDVLDDASPRLAAGADVTVLSGTAVKAAIAVGLLEEALGGMTGALGVIHAPRYAFGVLKGFVADKRGVMRTELGTRVVFGSGYPGTGPAGQARTPESTWVYATGPGLVARGPVLDLPGDDREALDRETNVATVQAVRIVSVGHSCGLVAVPVNLTA